MLRTSLLAAASVGASAYRRSHRDGATEVATEGGFEVFEVEEDAVEPVSLGNCEAVSRRRAFSTTCACRRRSNSGPEDLGLNCIDSTMQCEAGFEWNGERCASTAAPGDEASGDAGAAAAPVAPVTPAPPPHGAHRPIPPPVGSGETATNPVAEVYMYRAQEYDGDTPYAMENVNLADLPGVLQYIHREVITEHTIGSVDRRTGEARSARKYDISSLLRYRFLVKNPNSLSSVNMDFDGYATFDFGQASNQEQWNDFQTVGDAVGAQTQSNTHVPFPDPYYWFSLSGFCPNLPYTGSAITTLCPENLQTLSGTCLSKSEAATNGCWAEGEITFDKCLCYNGGSLVWGGLCGADVNRGPPSHIQVPTGDRGCTYSYEPHADVISLDDLTGITSELCNGGQPCQDWADFRANCDNSEYKKTFTPLGNLQRTAYCVEYDLHPDCAQLGCSSRQCQRIAEADREYGLPFWKGRCNERDNQRRAEQAAEAFGVADATTTHQATVPSSPGYEHTPCNRSASLECSPNMIYGEGYCTRAWSGVCTSCRIAGTLHPTANMAIHHCPWTVTDGEYSHLLQRGRWCSEPLLPSKVCCLYSDSCTIKIGDVPGQVDTLPLTDDSLALVLATSNTETVKSFLIRIAKELMGLSDADISAKDAELGTEAYWAWDDKPKHEFMMNDVIRLIKVTDLLHTLFPASEVYTTLPPTTSTTTTTARRWHVLTTASPRLVTDAPLSPECQCSETGIVNGVDTHRPGCNAHLGRHFGPFCYIEGGRECPGNIRFSRSLGVHYRKRCA